MNTNLPPARHLLNRDLITFMGRGAEVNAVDESDGTPALFVAAILGLEEVFSFLRESGATAGSLYGSEGINLLQAACTGGSESILSSALDGDRLHINGRDSGGWTALHYACNGKRANLVSILLSSGADPAIRSNGTNGSARKTAEEIAKSVGASECLAVFEAYRAVQAIERSLIVARAPSPRSLAP